MFIAIDLVSRLLLPITALSCAAALGAQCQLDWQPGTPIGGPSGRVTVMENLPNGDLIVGGWFLEAGAVTANRLARWDGATWSAFGAGLDGNVYDIVVAPNGDIIVAGKFQNAGGAPADRVARWDGSSWSPLGLGLNGIVNCLELLPNGNLLAAGVFTGSGATSTPLIAEWDGNSWSALGSGLIGGEIRSMARMGNGDLIVAGVLASAGGVATNQAARWDGVTWSALPLQLNLVSNVVATPNGNVAMYGFLDFVNFTTVGIWDGASMTPIANMQTFPTLGTIGDLFYDANGDLLSLHAFGSNGLSAVNRWNGSSWSAVGSGAAVQGIDLHQNATGELIVAGGSNVYLTPRPSMSSFDGNNWNTWGGPLQAMSAFASSQSGELYGASYSGAFSSSAVNRWNGSQWVPVGADVLGTATDVVPLQGGGLFACGYFQGGSSVLHAMLFDGSNWTVIGGDLGMSPLAAAEGPDGTLYIAGSTQMYNSSVLAFDGTDWDLLGSGFYDLVYDLTCLPNGDLFAAGVLALSGPRTSQGRRWDGSAWSNYGPLVTGRVRSVLAHPTDGTVLMAISESQGGSTASLVQGDGTGWAAIGGSFDGGISGLQRMPNDDLLVSGSFTAVGAASAAGIARWDGVSWTGVGAGANGPIGQVGMTRDGDLFASGGFTRLAGMPSAAFGRAITSCPASVQSYGSGCLGPNGPLVLAPLTSAWSGSAYRTRLYGTPSSAVVLHALGGSTVSVSLPSLLPQSFSGCSLLVTPDILDLMLPGTGDAEPTVQIASDPTLIGATFYQQALALQLDANANLLTVSSSNGLSATIGFF